MKTRKQPDQAGMAPFRLADSVSHLLHRAEQLANDRFARRMGDEGVTLRQFAVLAAIAAQPGLNQSELVRATGIDRSTLAEMVARMQKRGWIARAASAADARAYTLRLTGTGGAILAGATEHARIADAAVLEGLTRAKRKAFINTLIKLAAFADELSEKAERETKRKAKREAKERAKARAKEQAKPKREKKGPGKR